MVLLLRVSEDVTVGNTDKVVEEVAVRFAAIGVEAVVVAEVVVVIAAVAVGPAVATYRFGPFLVGELLVFLEVKEDKTAPILSQDRCALARNIPSCHCHCFRYLK